MTDPSKSNGGSAEFRARATRQFRVILSLLSVLIGLCAALAVFTVYTQGVEIRNQWVIITTLERRGQLFRRVASEGWLDSDQVDAILDGRDPYPLPNIRP